MFTLNNKDKKQKQKTYYSRNSFNKIKFKKLDK